MCNQPRPAASRLPRFTSFISNVVLSSCLLALLLLLVDFAATEPYPDDPVPSAKGPTRYKSSK
jgi:hypothetical protein